MGAGLGMGNMMAQGMSGMGGGQPAPFGGQVPAAATVAAPQPAAATAAPQPGDSCPKCGNTVPTGTKFCPECGSKLGQSFCSECGAKVMPGMKFCAECGNKL